MPKPTPRILVHFSCGAASAVAFKVATMRYADAVEAIYCDTSRDEHPDNARFKADIERWVGKTVTVLRHQKYQTVEDVVRGERYIVGRYGAACTRCLKREVGDRYARPDDQHVLGFTADEWDRIDAITGRHPKMEFLWLLAWAGVTKDDCYGILQRAGIQLPAMYRLGYGHNNCIGCWKGGKGYWNKIRRDFPDVFASRAKLQRELNVGLRTGDGYFFLDELREDEGLDQREPNIECGLFCSRYDELLEMAAQAKQEEPHA
jgi:hypothetical protein